jgi:membrane dipeptidase
MTDADAFHRSLLTIDTHIDIPWPDKPRDEQGGSDKGEVAAARERQVDLPKMRSGGLGCGCFAAYTPQTRRTPESRDAAFARAVAMLQAIRAMGGITGARFTTTAAEIEAARELGLIAVMPAVENGFAIGTQLDRLAQLRGLGARYLTLTHNGHNDLADSANPRKELEDPPAEHDGLSALGRAAVGELNRLGMLVDVAHVSKAAMLQAAAISRTPIVATHSCVRALCDHPRNLDDEQLDVLRDVGGVIQITAVPAFLRPQGKPQSVSVTDFADHIDYAVGRIGVEHVGISSDFDGGGGFSGWRDASETPNVTGELLRRGYGRREIAALWGGNFLRLLRAAEAAAEE